MLSECTGLLQLQVPRLWSGVGRKRLLNEFACIVPKCVLVFSSCFLPIERGKAVKKRAKVEDVCVCVRACVAHPHDAKGKGKWGAHAHRPSSLFYISSGNHV